MRILNLNKRKKMKMVSLETQKKLSSVLFEEKIKKNFVGDWLSQQQDVCI